MEAIFNDTLTVLTILSVVSVWGMVGAVIVVLAGVKDVEKSPTAPVVLALSWPIVLVFVAISTLVDWMREQ